MASKNKVQMHRTTIWIEDEQKKVIRENMEMANASSESEYIRMAIDFYSGYIKTDKVENYMLNTLSSMLHATIEKSEERIIRYVYKMAIEQGVLNRIIGIENSVDEEEFERILRVVEKEVKGI